MEIKWLKTFIVAAKYENLRKTSEELFLTQPAITKHVKRLEQHLHTELFSRNGKTVILTPAGHKFLPKALEIVTKYDEGIGEFELWKQGYRHKLTIAVAPQIASSFLTSLLRSFMDENPNIEVIINVTKSYDIGEIISEGRSDLGLTRIEPVQKNISSKIMHEEPVILVAPNENGDKILTEEGVLQRYRLITHNHPDYWDSLLNMINNIYPNARAMRVDQVEVTKLFIEAGLGISFLPRTMVKDNIKLNKMIEIKPDKIAVPVSTTYLVTKIETNEVIKFTEFIKDAVFE